jgi:hypothetical protein
VTYEFKEPLVVDSDDIQHTALAHAAPADTESDTTTVTAAAASGSTVDISGFSSISNALGNADFPDLRFIHFGVGEIATTANQPMLLSDIANTDSSAGPTATTEVDGSGSRRLQQSTALAVQDVLVVYTALAASVVGGVDALRSRVQENFARANLAYRDSKVPVQLTLLAFQPVRDCKGYSRGSYSIAELPGQDFCCCCCCHVARERR